MNNTCKREEQLRRNIDISRRYEFSCPDEQGRSWHFINLEEFEFQIRQEELEKYMALRRKERERRKWYRDAKSDLFKATLIPRMAGMLLIMMSVFAFILLSKMGETDGTWIMVTVPLGILFLTMPGWNRPRK